MLDLFQPLIERALRPARDAVLSAAGRTLVYSDAAQKYEAHAEADTLDHAPEVKLSDCASLIAWCTYVGESTKLELEGDHEGQVVISRTGITTACTPIMRKGHEAREAASKLFYKGFLPGEQFTATLGYADILAWFDLLGDALEGAEKWEIALKTISAADGRVTSVESDGAVLKVRSESETGVKAVAPLPKRLRAEIPFGDPACTVPVEFGLQVTADKGGAVSFHLRHLISDGAFDAYVTWMRKQLEALPPGWLVLVGP